MASGCGQESPSPGGARSQGKGRKVNTGLRGLAPCTGFPLKVVLEKNCGRTLPHDGRHARTCRPPPRRRDASSATAAPVTGQRYAAAGHTGPDLPVLVAAHSCVHAAVTSGDEAPAAKLHRQRGRSLVLSARPRVGPARTSSRQPPAATRKAYGSPAPCCALTLAGVKLYWQLSCRTRRVSKKSPRSTPLHAPRHRSPQLLPWTLSSSTRSAATTAL